MCLGHAAYSSEGARNKRREGHFKIEFRRVIFSNLFSKSLLVGLRVGGQRRCVAAVEATNYSQVRTTTLMIYLVKEVSITWAQGCCCCLCDYVYMIRAFHLKVPFLRSSCVYVLTCNPCQKARNLQALGRATNSAGVRALLPDSQAPLPVYAQRHSHEFGLHARPAPGHPHYVSHLSNNFCFFVLYV